MAPDSDDLALAMLREAHPADLRSSELRDRLSRALGRPLHIVAVGRCMDRLRARGLVELAGFGRYAAVAGPGA